MMKRCSDTHTPPLFPSHSLQLCSNLISSTIFYIIPFCYIPIHSSWLTLTRTYLLHRFDLAIWMSSSCADIYVSTSLSQWFVITLLYRACVTGGMSWDVMRCDPGWQQSHLFMSVVVGPDIIWYHITSYRNMLHHITSHHIMSHYIASCHIISHHITSRRHPFACLPYKHDAAVSRTLYHDMT